MKEKEPKQWTAIWVEVETKEKLDRQIDLLNAKRGKNKKVTRDSFINNLMEK